MANKFSKVVPPVAKAPEAAVLTLLVTEAERLEELKARARAAALARGMKEAEVDSLIPPIRAGTISLQKEAAEKE